jgi:type IV secretory pathway VirB6-like protein
MKITDKKTNKVRYCKNNTKYFYCKKHQLISYNDEYGTCCFCGDKCNPASQSCGHCIRRVMTSFIL